MSFAGLVLAGGRGERWGGPKAWARLPDGRTFLQACVQSLTAAGAGAIIATLPPGTTGYHPQGCECVVLPEDGLDMFASLRCALEYALHDKSWSSVVVLPVDHPLVQPATIRQLAAVDQGASIPTYQGKHGHPAVLSRCIAGRVLDGELAGPTLREVLRAVAAVDLEVDDSAVGVNCNSPEVLARNAT